MSMYFIKSEEELKDSPEMAEIEIYASPGLDLLSTAAIAANSQIAYEATKMFENSQVSGRRAALWSHFDILILLGSHVSPW